MKNLALQKSGERMIFSLSVWDHSIPIEENYINTYFTPHTNNSYRPIVDIKLRRKTTNLL